MENTFELDLQKIRTEARRHMEEGPVTASYGADKERVVEVCNQALATEIVCVLRYKNHYFMARGIHGESVSEEFKQHAAEEQVHADQIAERITQLGGTPNMNPEGLATRAHSEYKEAKDLRSMLTEDLVAERIAIETYSEIIRWLGNDDPTTRRMFEEILAKEEEHADDLASLMEEM
jgi:bacterioferritin